jgi:hypothetical protein
VTHAQTILSWQEHLTKEDQPPEWMWALDDELEEWFSELEVKRENRYGGGNDYTPPMMTNQLAKGRR